MPTSCAVSRTTRSPRRSASRRRSACRAVTDGEFRRASWHMDFIYQLDGVTKGQGSSPSSSTTSRATSSSRRRRCTSTGSSPSRKTIFGDAFSFLSEHVEHGAPKLTIPSPSMVHYRGGRSAIDEERLSRPRLVLERSGPPPTREEVRRLGELGCTLPPVRRHEPRLYERPGTSASTSPRSAAIQSTSTSSYIRHLNEAIADRPEGMRVTTHMCRGNFRSSWVGRGRLRLCRRGAAERPRRRRLLHGVGRRALRRLRAAAVPAEGRERVVLGLVTTKRGELESKGRPEAPHRGGVPLRAARTAVPLAAVRVLLDGRGELRSPRTSSGRSCGSWSKWPTKSGKEV